MNNKSYVSRKVYQKLAEKNKRLLKDLKTICCGTMEERFLTRLHWREHFRKEDKLKSELERFLREYTKKDPSLKHQN